mmetsp:Transcript_8485/g.18294  ORF Transcript_8485/g.18294 Transcript_8485/m.18294 type:complete len:80 (-) Transcript_8485:476-715(-)
MTTTSCEGVLRRHACIHRSIEQKEENAFGSEKRHLRVASYHGSSSSSRRSATLGILEPPLLLTLTPMLRSLPRIVPSIL